MARDESQGIYRKYQVTRLNDPNGKHDICEFFVLDLRHDRHAVPALRTYAKSCSKKFPQLAKDIRRTLYVLHERKLGRGGDFLITPLEQAIVHEGAARTPPTPTPKGETP